MREPGEGEGVETGDLAAIELENPVPGPVQKAGMLPRDPFRGDLRWQCDGPGVHAWSAFRKAAWRVIGAGIMRRINVPLSGIRMKSIILIAIVNKIVSRFDA
jgi:hypothetical protein